MPDTDPRLAIKQVVSAPGFWNQPKEQQVQAIGQIYPKIASAPQDVQDRILAQGRVAFGGGNPPPPPGARTGGGVGGGGITPMSGGGRGVTIQQSIEGRSDTGEFDPVGKTWSALTKPLAEGIRQPIEKAAGAVTGAIPKLLHAPAGVSDFSAGLGEGLADAGINLTSPANLALMVGTVFIPEGALAESSPKAAKLIKAVKTAMRYGFKTSMGFNALKQVPGFMEAMDKNDYKGMGKAVSNALADLYLIKQTKGGKGAKVEPGESAPPPPPEMSAEAAPTPAPEPLPVNNNPRNLQYTAQKVPGVPAGTKIIPRGAVAGKGFLVEVVGADGKTTQKILPGNDTIENMARKGWIRLTPMVGAVEQFHNPAYPPAGPVEEVGARSPLLQDKTVAAKPSENLPATVQRSTHPPGPTPFASPEQVAAAEHANPATEQAAREAAYMEEPSPAQPKAKPKTRAPKAAKPKAVTPQPEPPPPPSGPAEVQHVGPELKASLQDLIDNHINPTKSVHSLGTGNAVRSPWENVTVELLDAGRQPIATKTMPGGDFTSDSIGSWAAGTKGAVALRISEPGRPAEGKITRFLPQAKPPGPPEQVR